MKTVLEARGLSKRYGAQLAVDSLDLSVGEGEVYGFLGLNGAGKTTTMRMLLGMIRASAGEAFVLGKKIGSSGTDIWTKVGYMIETPSAYPELTLRENLEVARRLRGLAATDIERVMHLLNIEQYADRAAGKLSLGNLQRLGLAKALIHRPKVLLLDEPVNGLDPEGIADIRELLRGLARNEGVSVLVSSHLLDEISKIADRIGIIHKGKMLKELDTAELEASLDTRLVLSTGDNDAAHRFLSSAGLEPRISGGLIELRDRESITRPENVAAKVVHESLALKELLVEREDLESYFLRCIGEKPEGALQ